MKVRTNTCENKTVLQTPKKIAPILENFGIKSSRGYFTRDVRGVVYTAWDDSGNTIAVLRRVGKDWILEKSGERKISREA